MRATAAPAGAPGPEIALLLFLFALCGCSASQGRSDPPTAAAPSPPWAAPALQPAAVPPVYLAVWRSAANRQACALVAPVDLGSRSVATPRSATFSGGWAVAYDLPDLRSAFGVAGTGAPAAGDAYASWPYRIEWADGSSAEYGLEGGTGPNHLAYLRIAGQDCLYNVWSRLGVGHLEELISSLRWVRADGA